MVEQCSCSDSSSTSGTVIIDCRSLSLNDDQVKSVIDNLNTAMANVDSFYLQGNALTFVPSGLAQFSQLTTVDLSTNQITEIKAGDLTLSAAVLSLDLSGNQIVNIASGALPGKIYFIFYFSQLWNLIWSVKNVLVTIFYTIATYATPVAINLENNQLTAFSEDVFKPIIDGFILNSQNINTISVAGSNLKQIFK